MEVRFKTPLALEEVDKIRDEIASKDSLVKAMSEYQLQLISGAGPASVSNRTVGYRIDSLASIDVVLLSLSFISQARLAPYDGWEAFSTRALNNIERTRKVVGYKPLARIGLRYLNRIDIPLTNPLKPIRIEDYITLYPEYPESSFPGLSHFTMQTVFDFAEVAYRATINVAGIPSPVPNHSSFLLDIDVAKETDVPQNERAIRELLNVMRNEKNRLFEMCITDASRRLFGQ